MVKKDSVDSYWDKIYGEEEVVAEETAEVQQQEEVGKETVQEQVAETVQEAVHEEIVQEQEQVETASVEYKSNKKYIPIEDEEGLYQKLNTKYGGKNLSDEQKALAYLREKNPHLDENDIQFLASEKYGIGVEDLDVTALTDLQIKALREQGIDKKNLFAEARGYFDEKAKEVNIEPLDPFEIDEEYKGYIADRKKVQEQLKTQEKIFKETLQGIQTAAASISEINEQFNIDIDDSKFAVDVSFKTNADKQKQLTEFAGRYMPSDSEVKQFTDPQTGKFDYKGYLTYLSPMAYARDMIVAGIRQGIVKNREQFIEKELKNSTLRTNDSSVVADKKIDPNDAYWEKTYGGN